MLLALIETMRGPDHLDAAVMLDNLAVLHQRQGRHAEAEPLYRRSLALRAETVRRGPPRGRGIPGQSRQRCMRARAATPRPSRSTSAASPSARRRWAPTTPTSAPRSTTWPSSTKPRAATPRPSRSTSARWPSARRRWAPTTPTSAPRSTTWPRCTSGQGRYAEAEPLYKRALAHPREGAGPRPPRRRQRAQQPGRAVPGARAATPRPSRSTSAASPLREKALGPDHPDVGQLAQQPGRAVPRPGPLRRGRAALQAQPAPSREGAGAPTTPTSAPRSTTWPSCIAAQGRYAEAEPLYKRSLAISEKALGPDHPDVGTVAQQPGRGCTGRRAATPRPSRSTSARSAIREKALGPDHPDVGICAQQPGRAVLRASAIGRSAADFGAAQH